MRYLPAGIRDPPKRILSRRSLWTALRLIRPLKFCEYDLLPQIKHREERALLSDLTLIDVLCEMADLSLTITGMILLQGFISERGGISKVLLFT